MALHSVMLRMDVDTDDRADAPDVFWSRVLALPANELEFEVDGTVLPLRYSYGFHRLTARQKQIAQLLSHGLSNPDIAHDLGIKIATVKVAVADICDRLGVSDRIAVAVTIAQADIRQANRDKGTTWKN